jgi:hypothetical protein
VSSSPGTSGRCKASGSLCGSLLRNFVRNVYASHSWLFSRSSKMRSTTLLAFVLAPLALAYELETEFCAPTIVFHYCVLVC